MAALSQRGFSLSRRRFTLFLMLVLCLSSATRAQSGGAIRMSGGVSETVSLSIPQTAQASVAGVSVNTSQNADRTLAVTLSGAARGLTEVRIPVQIRSNTGYRLFAAARAGGENLSSLLVVGARPTGSLVTTDAAEAVNIAAALDGRRGADNSTFTDDFRRPNLNRLNINAPTELLSGPRVSAGGTLLSPHNALEVVLSVAVEPRAGNQLWTVELLLSAAPAEHF